MRYTIAAKQENRGWLEFHLESRLIPGAFWRVPVCEEDYNALSVGQEITVDVVAVPKEEK